MEKQVRDLASSRDDLYHMIQSLSKGVGNGSHASYGEIEELRQAQTLSLTMTV